MTSRPLAFRGAVLSGPPWLWSPAPSRGRGRGSGPVTVAFTGIQTSGGLSQALALTVLAGTLLILVLRVRGRQGVAGLLGLLGVGLLLVGLLQREPSPALVRQQVLDISLLDTVVLRTTGWPWAYAVAGVLVLVGSALTLLRSGAGRGGPTGSGVTPAPLNDLVGPTPPSCGKRWMPARTRRIGQADHGTAGRDRIARGPRCAQSDLTRHNGKKGRPDPNSRCGGSEEAWPLLINRPRRRRVTLPASR